jgi:hypothetical protein
MRRLTGLLKVAFFLSTAVSLNLPRVLAQTRGTTTVHTAPSHATAGPGRSVTVPSSHAAPRAGQLSEGQSTRHPLGGQWPYGGQDQRPLGGQWPYGGQDQRPLGGQWPYGTQTQRPETGHHGVSSHERLPFYGGAYSGVLPLGFGLPLNYSDGLASTENYQQEADAQQPAPPPPADSTLNDDNQRAPSGMPANEYRPMYRPEYQGAVTFAPVKAQPATTLIFNDGRPSEQVHNYALTSSTLYDLDGERRREIPLSLLNVPATVTINRSAGVDFALPVNR